MAGASVYHFFKHLTRSLRCTQLPSRPSNSLSRINHLPLSLTSSTELHLISSRFRRPWIPFSHSASISSPAPSESTSTDSGVPPYISILIRCRKDVADMLSEALLSFGASSISMDEHEDYENSEQVSICSVFTECGDVNACISRAADSVGLEETPSFEVLKYNPYDWIKRTQESFDPVKVTEGLWIVPEWRAPVDTDATNIFLNPGLAFGTGEHATTKLCLLLLHRSIKGGELVLDYGTGSGILSIAALKLGATRSVGVDIDPQAITAAHQNAVLNNIGPDQLNLSLVLEKNNPSLVDKKMNGDLEVQKFMKEKVLPDKNKYDIVVANILLNPLLDLAEEIISHAKAGAVVGLSGILSEQVPYVMERYSEFLENITVSVLEDWACLSGTKKENLADI